MWVYSSLTLPLHCISLINISTDQSPRYQRYVNSVNLVAYKTHSTSKIFTTPEAVVSVNRVFQPQAT